jgi:hypothetical protein
VKLQPENPHEWPAQSDAVCCPPGGVKEPAGTGLDGLRSGIRHLRQERYPEQREAEPMVRSVHQLLPERSRTGRPLRKSTR